MLLSLYLALHPIVQVLRRDRARLEAVVARRLHGARSASEFWFLAFALDHSVASVRTLALVEVLFAQAMALRASSSSSRPHRAKASGIVLVMIGVLPCWYGRIDVSDCDSAGRYF